MADYAERHRAALAEKRKGATAVAALWGFLVVTAGKLQSGITAFARLYIEFRATTVPPTEARPSIAKILSTKLIGADWAQTQSLLQLEFAKLPLVAGCPGSG